MFLICLFVCLIIIRFAQLQSNYDMAHLWPNSLFSFLNTFQFSKKWILIAILIIPPVLLTKLFIAILLSVGGIFSLLDFLFSGFIFWVCLGPYPKNSLANNTHTHYIQQWHTHLFAILFWALFFGPEGALAFRIIHDLTRLAQDEQHPLHTVKSMLEKLLQYAEYIPIRISLLLGAAAHLSFKELGSFALRISEPASKNCQLFERSCLSLSGLDPELVDTNLNPDDHARVTQCLERIFYAYLAIVAFFTLIFIF